MMPRIAPCPLAGRLEDAEPFAAIDGLAQRPPPGFVGEIPGNGFFQPGVEALLRSPSGFALDQRRIDGAAAVMARAVGNELDEVGMRLARRPQPVEDAADAGDDVDVRALPARADIV